MNFTSMEYFLTLARERSFTRAAERLHITQQTLSFHIAGIEKELGSQLFLRKSPLRLTYAGEVFLRYAESFQKEITELRQEFCDISENQKGVLRIGIAHTRSRVIMPDIIPVYQISFPNISVELEEVSNEVAKEKLLKGELHLAIASFPEVLPGIRLKEFYDEEVVLLISENCFSETFGNAAAAAEKALLSGDRSVLASCPFVLGDGKDIASPIGSAVLNSAGINRPLVKASSHNMETILALCLKDVGACFCPDVLARGVLSPEEMNRLMLFRLGEEARYPIRFGLSEQVYQWSAAEAFMEVAGEQMRKIT